MTPRLEVTGAIVRFGDVVALAGADLVVQPGEVVGILGPSGSGKSTLLRAVAGLQPLGEGKVRLDGADVGEVPPHRRGVGLMFQEQALFPHHDVAGNVGFGLRMQGWERQAVVARVGELLDLVGLTGMEGRAVTTLSGGQRQRVALARALAPEPRLLLLDEPFGALDRTLRERLVADLRSLIRDLGLTVVAVSHDQTDAFALADRIVVVHEGATIRSGTPAEVWEDPQRASVAQLLGFDNLAEATPSSGDSVVTPWGPVSTPEPVDGATMVLVRPDAVVVDDEGPHRAVVVSVTFAGRHSVLRLQVDGAPPLDAEVPSDRAPAIGRQVAYRLEARGVRLLAP